MLGKNSTLLGPKGSSLQAAAAAVSSQQLPASQCRVLPGRGFSRRKFAALAAGRPLQRTPAALPPTRSSGIGKARLQPRPAASQCQVGRAPPVLEARKAPARGPLQGSGWPAQGRGIARVSNQLSWANPDVAKAEDILRKLPLNEEQMAAATSDTKKPKMIRAGAGTGKTTTMVGRIIYMTLGKGINPREIMGVTFTKKAAEELKERVAAGGVRDVKVTTFHSFCYDVLKRFHREAGFPTVPLIWSNANELQAVMAEAMRTVSLHSAQVRLAGWLRLPESACRGPTGREMIKQAVATQYPDEFRRAMEVAGENMESALSKRDREALEKEREDEQAVGKISELPRSAMSPDKRGWKSKKVERVTELEQLQQLYEHVMKRVEPGAWESLYGEQPRKRLAEEKARKGGKKAAVRDTLPYDYKLPGKIPDNTQVKLAFKWMESQKTRGLKPSDFGPHGDALAYQQFQRLLREARAVDFGDMLMLVRDLLRQERAVRMRLQAWHPYLLVDEYQDSNPLQIDIVDALQSEMQQVTVVGDDFQAIFGFRGSQPDVFQRFIDTFQHDNLQQPLQDNYRSRPAILDVGIAALQDSLKLLHKELRPTKAATVHKVTIWEAGHILQEAEQIADKARLLHETEGVPYEEMAVLLRVFRGQYTPLYRTYENAFLRAGIPVTIVKGRAFLEGKDVMNALAYVRLMLNSRDDVAFRRVFNLPKRSLGPKFEEDLQKYRDEKRMRLDAEDEPENGNDSAADCSLMQCCHEMLAKGLVGSRFEKGIRSFIDFVDETRMKSLQWTPSQTLMHILVDSGLLETIKAEAKREKAKAKKQGDEGHALQTALSDNHEEEWDGSEASEDDEAWLEDSKEGGDLYSTLLPDELETLRSVACQFEAEYVDSLDADPFTERSSGEGGLGTETLLRMSEGFGARGTPVQELTFNAHARSMEGSLPLRSFLEHLSLSAAEVTGSKKGVVISTIHAAKGLEWDVVFVPGLNNGLMPCSWRPEGGLLPLGQERLAEGQEAFKILAEWGVRHRPRRRMLRVEEVVMEHFDEEARLFHVAITRGRERVILSYNRHQLVVPKEMKMPPFAVPLDRSFFLQRVESRCATRVLPQDERERALTAQRRYAASFDSDED